MEQIAFHFYLVGKRGLEKVEISYLTMQPFNQDSIKNQVSPIKQQRQQTPIFSCIENCNCKKITCINVKFSKIVKKIWVGLSIGKKKDLGNFMLNVNSSEVCVVLQAESSISFNFSSIDNLSQKSRRCVCYGLDFKKH